MPRRLILLVCILATCPYVGPGQSAPPAVTQIRKGTGFILGRTVDVGTGQPVAGAVVTLTGYGEVPGGVPGGPQAAAPVTSAQLTASRPRSVITTSDGYFFFRELNGGRFAIAATAMGFLPGGYLQNKPNSAVHFIDLGENEQRGDVQIKLWKYGAISGTVLDEAGEPAVGATVRLMQRGATYGRLLSSGRTELTDDRGSYRFGGLVPGDYIAGIITTQSTIPAGLVDTYLEAQASDPARFEALALEVRTNGALAPSRNSGGVRIGDLIFPLTGNARLGYTPPQPADDGRMLSYVTTFFQNAPISTEAATITLGSGEERTGVDLAIKLMPTVKISGTLTGPDGPARNMGVRLVPAGSDLFVDDGFIAAATTATDANSVFTFLGVPAGSYTLKSTRLSALVRTGPTLPGPPPVLMLWAAQPITVDNADLTGVNVVLRPGLTVSGHFEFVGSKPAPTAGFSVSLAPVNGGVPARSSAALMAPDGTFFTGGDPPGRYFALADGAGWTLRSVKYNGRNIADESFELTSSDLADVVVTFIDTPPSKLTGTITDAKGAPDALADVIVFPADADGWRRGEIIGRRRMQLVQATKAGTYGVATLAAGQYYVVAVDDSVTGHWTDPKFLERLIAGATKVTIAEGDDKTVALKTFTIR
jgi:hypothetical protein